MILLLLIYTTRCQGLVHTVKMLHWQTTSPASKVMTLFVSKAVINWLVKVLPYCYCFKMSVIEPVTSLGTGLHYATLLADRMGGGELCNRSMYESHSWSPVFTSALLQHHLAFLNLCNGTFGSSTERRMQGSDLYSPREPHLSLPLSLSLSGLGGELRAVCRPKPQKSR